MLRLSSLNKEVDVYTLRIRKVIRNNEKEDFQTTKLQWFFQKLQLLHSKWDPIFI